MRNIRHSESYRLALEFAEGHIEYIIDIYDNGDWTEIRGEIGGDIVTYRVYESGVIAAR